MTLESDFSRAMYPFLYQSDVVAPDAALLASVRSSTLAKCSETIALRSEMLVEYGEALSQAAREMAHRFAIGGKLLAFGNGGSATDADDAAIDCLNPPQAGWQALPACSLSSDSATLTALANDVGLENVFARQMSALADRDDIAVGFSTSGTSANVVAAFADAKKRGLLTIALTGYDGGTVARSGTVDFCFVARREFVPRIQEGHATMWHTLLDLVQRVIAHDTEALT